MPKKKGNKKSKSKNKYRANQNINKYKKKRTYLEMINNNIYNQIENPINFNLMRPKKKESNKNDDAILENNNDNYSKIKLLIFPQTLNIDQLNNILILFNNEISSQDTYRTYNKYLYHLVLRKENIRFEDSEEIQIKKDGNCFYNNLSFFYSGKEIYNKFFRAIIYKYVNENNNILIDNPYIMNDNGENIEVDKYIKNISKDSYYAGELEISNSTKIFNLNIAVYIKDGTDNIYKFLMYFSQKENSFEKDLLILVYYADIKHYNQIHYITKNNINNDIDNHNKKIKNHLNNNIKINDKENNTLNSIIQIFKEYKNNILNE